MIRDLRAPLANKPPKNGLDRPSSRFARGDIDNGTIKKALIKRSGPFLFRPETKEIALRREACSLCDEPTVLSGEPTALPDSFLQAVQVSEAFIPAIKSRAGIDMAHAT